VLGVVAPAAFLFYSLLRRESFFFDGNAHRIPYCGRRRGRGRMRLQLVHENGKTNGFGYDAAHLCMRPTPNHLFCHFQY
jgi:hypothetical protein